VPNSPAGLPDLTTQVGTFLSDAGQNASVFSNSRTLVTVWTGLDSLVQLWNNNLNGDTSGEAPLVTQLTGLVATQLQTIRNATIFAATPPTVLFITLPPAETSPLAVSDAGGDQGLLGTLAPLGAQFNSELLSGASGMGAQTWDASAFWKNLTSNPAEVCPYLLVFCR
jgi:hypothetical protein